MVKTDKVEKLQMMLKTMPDLLGKYEKQVRGKLRKNFLERLMLFSEELQFLESRVGEGSMV